MIFSAWPACIPYGGDSGSEDRVWSWAASSMAVAVSEDLDPLAKVATWAPEPRSKWPFLVAWTRRLGLHSYHLLQMKMTLYLVIQSDMYMH